MRAGYVRDEDSLRFRDKVHDPHWAQGLIGEVYAFKTLYDVRASRGGVGPITLQESVAAFHYYRWGVVAAAERATHDLFKCMQTHRTVSRFKMFSALLGHTLPSHTHTPHTHAHHTQTPHTADMAEVLHTTHALSSFFNLLCEIHREMDHTKTELEREIHQSRGETAILSETSGGGMMGVKSDSSPPLLNPAPYSPQPKGSFYGPIERMHGRYPQIC